MSWMVSHVIFDMDGTVVDSESLLFSAIDVLSAKYKVSADLETKAKLLGHPLKERAIQLYSDLGFEKYLTFQSFVSQLVSDCIQNVTNNGMKLMPGIERLVNHLRVNNIPMAIATGNDSNSYEGTKQRFHPFFNNFLFALKSGDKEEAISPKPSPDIYLKAFNKFGYFSGENPLNESNVLVFEDSEVGVLSAISAGMKCVYVVDRRLNPRLESDIASQVIYSLEDFKPELFGLPQFQ